MSNSARYALLCVCVSLCLGCARNRQSNEEEPMIIYRSEDGRIIRREDLREVTGTISYEIISSRNVPRKAQELHNNGRAAGANGDYEKAIALFEQATTIAPEWPYPIYDQAYTYLLMMDFEAAREYYTKTMELSPRGFFKVITALDTLNHEKEGTFPKGTYLRYLSIEWIEDTVKKLQALEKLTEEIPAFAPAWLDLAGLLQDSEQQIAAIKVGLSLHSDIETKGLLLLSKATALNQKGQKDQAIKILGKLILDPDSTILVNKLAKETLFFLTDEDTK